jgi:hypothetical protein
MSDPNNRGCDLHLRISPDERRVIKAIADRECRSANGQVLKWVREKIAEERASLDPMGEGSRITAATRRLSS